jgi:hypothetical protein
MDSKRNTLRVPNLKEKRPNEAFTLLAEPMSFGCFSGCTLLLQRENTMAEGMNTEAKKKSKTGGHYGGH